jgi:hypothetical protein
MEFPRYQTQKYPQKLDDIRGLIEKWKNVIEILSLFHASLDLPADVDV